MSLRILSAEVSFESVFIVLRGTLLLMYFSFSDSMNIVLRTRITAMIRTTSTTHTTEMIRTLLFSSEDLPPLKWIFLFILFYYLFIYLLPNSKTLNMYFFSLSSKVLVPGYFKNIGENPWSRAAFILFKSYKI